MWFRPKVDPKGGLVAAGVVALVVLLFPVARGGEKRGGLAALDAFLASAACRPGETILGMVGFYGEPVPPQWLVLTSHPDEAGVLRESVVSGGKVRAERKFSPLPGQDLPDIPIERGALGIDSGEAFAIAEKVAREGKISFDSAHFQLRCRERGNEPVWMLSLLSPAQVSVGAIYVSAIDGEVLRVSWTRAGGNALSSVNSEQ